MPSDSGCRETAIEESGCLAPFGRLVLDERFCVLEVDASFLHHFECETDDVLGRSFDGMILERDRQGAAAFSSALREFAGGHADVSCGLAVAEQEMLTRLRFGRSGTGWVIYAERLREGDFLRKLIIGKERWRSIITASSEGVVILDENGRIQEHNASFLDLMRLESRHGVRLNEDAIIGKPFFELVGESLAPVAEAFREKRIARRRFQREIAYQARILEIRMHPIVVPVSGFAGVSLVVNDLTPAKELERLRLDQSRQRGVAEVCSSVIHNIGNALNSLGVTATLLDERLAGTKAPRLNQALGLLEQRKGDLGDYLENDPKGSQLPRFLRMLGQHWCEADATSREQLQEMLRIVDRIKLMVSAQQAHAYAKEADEEFSVESVIEEAVALSNVGQAHPDLDFRREITAGIIQRGDRHSLQQILINLLTNAADAVCETDLEQKRVVVRSAAVDDGWIRIEVADSGIGITEDQEARIFEQGFTSKAEGHGFGLHGSAILAKQSGGRLEFESPGLGKGSTFRLLLPLKRGPVGGESS